MTNVFVAALFGGTTLSDADTAYVTAMIGHHETAVLMSKQYLSAPVAQRRADVSALAENVITAQTAEISRMRSWLAAAGRPEPRPVTGTAMGGSGMSGSGMSGTRM